MLDGDKEFTPPICVICAVLALDIKAESHSDAWCIVTCLSRNSMANTGHDKKTASYREND